jgi:hypothetical protein
MGKFLSDKVNLVNIHIFSEIMSSCKQSIIYNCLYIPIMHLWGYECRLCGYLPDYLEDEDKYVHINNTCMNETDNVHVERRSKGKVINNYGK